MDKHFSLPLLKGQWNPKMCCLKCIWWTMVFSDYMLVMVWSGYEKKHWIEKKNLKFWWNLMKSDEIWWNLMKSWFHQISSDFIRFHFSTIFSPHHLVFFPPRSMSNKKYGTPFCGINRPNLLKGNCNSAELWTLRKIFNCINVWKICSEQLLLNWGPIA